MIKINSIKVFFAENIHPLSDVMMGWFFTIALFFNLFLYGFSDENGFPIILVNSIFLIAYVVSSFAFKNAMKVLTKDLISLILAMLPFILSSIYFGGKFFLNEKLVYCFIFISFIIDFILFVSYNNKRVFFIVDKALKNNCLDYSVKEEEVHKKSFKRSFLGVIILLFSLIAFPFLILFGKSLPYVFFGVSGNFDEKFLEGGIFVITFICAYFSSNYIYIYAMILYYFIKIIISNPHSN